MVRAGWNTELGRKKWDVELDEPDLRRFLLENGLPPDAPLFMSEAFWLLHYSAEILHDVTKAQLYDEAKDDSQRDAVLAHAQQNKTERDKWLEKVKARLDGQAAPA
jgi:hypothetical protein